jgi:PAS domain S-box-containing protein
MNSDSPLPVSGNAPNSRELRYLRARNNELVAKVLSLDIKSIRLRHELEQKRRGFTLMADIAETMEGGGDYQSVFVSVSKRINASLNMQRTAVLLPESGGIFRAAVLQGYTPEEERRIMDMPLAVDARLLHSRRTEVVTAADPPELLASLRADLALPYCIVSPIVLRNEIAAVLITGRLVEQHPFLLRLSPHDVEIIQAVSVFLAAMLSGRHLVEAEERTRIMLDAMPLCCMFFDENGRIIDCNLETVRLFGLSSKQEALDRWNELSPKYQLNGKPSSEFASKLIQKAFSVGRQRFEWIHRSTDGEILPTEVTLVRIKRGNIHNMVAYVRDLREFKSMMAEIRQNEQDLRKARDLAEKNARIKSEFLANMSHEIRTPMNAIVGMTHLLANTPLTEGQRRYVEQARHSADLLLRIFNDILEFSKLDTGRVELHEQRFSLRDLMENVRGIAEEQAAAKGLTVRSVVENDVPDMLLGDPLRLEQVFLHLVGNAVKFTREGGLTLRASLDDRGQTDGREHARVLFAVEDTGVGIGEKQARDLFTPFMQADLSSTRKYGGTGLGLAICRSLVELMRGEIRCKSKPGEGSSFSFDALFALPRKTASESGMQDGAARCRLPETEDAPSLPADDFADLRDMRVLLTEDNEINQMIACELLLEKGIAVDVAGTGMEALAALEDKRYDAVLMDIQMPEMDGLTATSRIRANPRHKDLPVIALTAHAMDEDRTKSLKVGMNDHLTKPIDPLLLYAALRKWDRRGSRRLSGAPGSG